MCTKAQMVSKGQNKKKIHFPNTPNVYQFHHMEFKIWTILQDEDQLSFSCLNDRIYLSRMLDMNSNTANILNI